MATASTGRIAPLMVLAATALACGGSAEQGQLVSKKLLTPGQEELTTENGMSTNGMSTNGMSTNGMSTNGMKGNGLLLSGASSSSISQSGLSQSTLSSAAFNTWFQANTTYANMVMSYVVRCAVPNGQTRSYSHAGVTYSWPGALGVAPFWSAGFPISLLEQQVVSACLGAHANRFGVHVPFSIVGFKGDQTVLPFGSGEQATYPNPEGAFFGNLFNGGTVYSCSSTVTDNAGISGPRECAMADMPSNVCAPLVDTLKNCSAICLGLNVPGLGYLYVACNAPDGHLYPALSTALENADIYYCGDGTCQFTESCYDSTSKTGCLSDCGRCN